MTKIEKIEVITRKMTELLLEGPMLPGRINEQWNVCGRKRCRCHDKIKPRRHGPYSQLSFTLSGKSSSMFIKSINLQKAQQCTACYREFKRLFAQLVEAYVAVVRRQGFEQEQIEEQENDDY